MRQPRRTAAAGFLLATTLIAAADGPSRAQTSEPTAATIAERAGRYVEAYETAFSALVCEEHQVQRIVRVDGSVRKQRELRSDFLLIRLGPVWMPPFRDVIEVDRKPVRNREDRLRKLFLETPKSAVEQAKAISEESRRHDIGFRRFPNSPLLPLRYLHPRIASGVRFARSGGSLTFEEFRSPSLQRGRRGNMTQDLMGRGSYVLDAEGRVLSAELSAGGPEVLFTTAMSVRYRDEGQLKLLVPSDMQESYRESQKPRADRLEVTSSYSNFRRFQVSTEERIKVPATK